MSLLLWTLGALVSAFIGLLLTVLFQDRVSVVLVKALRGFWIDDGRRTLTGIWYSCYFIFPDEGTSPSAAAPNDVILTVRLRQVGKRVAGTGVEISRNYSTLAILQDSYLTGTWRNFVNERYSWGAFQLWWHNNGRWMIGKFAGKDSYNHINHGIWVWARAQGELRAAADWAINSGYVSDIARFQKQLDDTLHGPSGSGN